MSEAREATSHSTVGTKITVSKTAVAATSRARMARRASKHRAQEREREERRGAGMELNGDAPPQDIPGEPARPAVYNAAAEGPDEEQHDRSEQILLPDDARIVDGPQRRRVKDRAAERGAAADVPRSQRVKHANGANVDRRREERGPEWVGEQGDGQEHIDRGGEVERTNGGRDAGGGQGAMREGGAREGEQIRLVAQERGLIQPDQAGKRRNGEHEQQMPVAGPRARMPAQSGERAAWAGECGVPARVRAVVGVAPGRRTQAHGCRNPICRRLVMVSCRRLPGQLIETCRWCALPVYATRPGEAATHPPDQPGWHPGPE